MVLFTAWHPAINEVVYSNPDAEAFRAQLESWEYPLRYEGAGEGEAFYNLTELAETAATDEEIELDDGVRVTFYSMIRSYAQCNCPSDRNYLHNIT